MKILIKVAVVFVIFLVLLVACVSVLNSNNTNTQTGDSQPAVTQEKPIEVSATTLLKDFESNEAAGRIKYGNKLLKITGYVDHVSVVLDVPYVYLSNGDEFAINTVSCKFSKSDLEKVSAFTRGQKVTITGNAGKDISLITFDLTDCTIN